MRRILSIALLVSSCAIPICALNNRSAVSVNGLDTNPCTPASPCRSFSVAVAATAPAAEVIALDSAGYGAFTITSSMTVSGAPGIRASITVTTPGVNGITINAGASDLVTLNNLVLIGPGAADAVYIQNAGDSRLFNCSAIGWSSVGFDLGKGHLLVDHCTLLDSAIGVRLNGLLAPVSGTIVSTVIENSSIGIDVTDSAQAAITGSTISGSGSVGIRVLSNTVTGMASRALISNSTITFCSIGVYAETASALTGDTAYAYLAQNDIAFCSTGSDHIFLGQVYSYGNNRFTSAPVAAAMSAVTAQ